MKRADKRQTACLFMALFGLRVIAQLVQLLSPQPWLPDFSAWQSGALSYQVLLILQLLVLVVGGAISILLVQNRLMLSAIARSSLTIIGAIYLSFMLLRGIIGVALPSHHFWGALIPTVFHIMLAAWILLVAETSE